MSPQVWTIPDPPGPEVLALVDRHGRLFARSGDMWVLSGRRTWVQGAVLMSWQSVFCAGWPLTDATVHNGVGPVTGEVS